jgi:hypothetical protein
MLVPHPKKALVILSVFFGFITSGFSQTQHVKLNWQFYESIGIEGFDGCDIRTIKDQSLPWYSINLELSTTSATANVQNLIYKSVFNNGIRTALELEGMESPMQYSIGAARDKKIINVEICPYRIVNNQLQRLESFDLVLKETGEIVKDDNSRPDNRRWATNSVLSTGKWFKISIEEDGVYKLDKKFLSDLGIDVSSLDPRTIKVYGNHGAMLPELNSAFRNDDLMENAIQIVGESDGTFDKEDYILFYGEGPHKWKFNESAGKYDHITNLYSNKTYYFITFGGDRGERIIQNNSGSTLSHDVTVNEFDDFVFHEEEKINHLKSGKTWYGESFDIDNIRSFNETFENLVKDEPVHLSAIMVARSLVRSSFDVSANGNAILSTSMSSVGTGSTSAKTSFPVVDTGSFYSNSDQINLTFNYSKNLSSSVGWLDYYELHAKRHLATASSQNRFLSIKSKDYNVTKYEISGSHDIKVWNVTDPFSVIEQNTSSSNNSKEFKSENSGEIEKFIMFENEFMSAEIVGEVANQNLHGIPAVEYLVITHEDFLEAAQKLVDYRASKGLTGRAVTTKEIFNEYSSGSQDVVAMRDFIKSIYDKDNNTLKYVLMFGDGSYDYKDIIHGNNNYVPTYESKESYAPVDSYCSNDYFGFLDENEGRWWGNVKHYMDVCVGRIPVNSLSQGLAMVKKIQHYESNKTLGDWRNRVVYAADDGDLKWDSIHIDDAEDLFHISATDHTEYNSRKIYLDAFKQESLGGSSRYPDATSEFNKFMDKGSLVMNYTGHGGEQGLAQESLIDVPTINKWNNLDNMPLFITATCEFSRYDDPERLSAGEHSLLNEEGGMIGLMTTVRLVRPGPNKYLNLRIWKDNLFDDFEETPTIGEIFLHGKNLNVISYNDRNFTLLGDPALKLNYPLHNVKTDSINGSHILLYSDTIRALQNVTISGHLESKSGTILNNFNGVVYPTVFDKPTTERTLLNDANSVLQEFEVQQDILYRGKTQVVNGFFTFTFVVPKDINYQVGLGKISYYAENGEEDGHGFENSILIGGSNGSSVVDTEGPQIELWMDDYSFVSGGVTSESPLLIARVSDVSGINTAGSGIGREITAVLDKETEGEKTFILNDYYESDLNSFQEGEVRYRLSDLPTGQHNIKVKFWDSYNNSSEAELDFIVADDAKLALTHVLNYPNPFITNTTFHFNHNKAGQDLNVTLQVLTMSGRVVKTINELVSASDSHVTDLTWNGKDDNGNNIANGVYLYKLSVKSEDGNRAYQYEKLVVLN